MRAAILLVPVVAIGFCVSVPPLQATSAYAKKEKKSCTFCHAKVVKAKPDMVNNLNAAGSCYKDNGHSLAKCSASK